MGYQVLLLHWQLLPALTMYLQVGMIADNYLKTLEEVGDGLQQVHKDPQALIGIGIEARPPDSTENDDGLTATEQFQLRLQEEEALNRAILMSLQATDSITDLTSSVEGSSSGEETVAFEPDESSVEMITGMGFTRDQAVEALRRKRGNVDRAIDFLIN